MSMEDTRQLLAAYQSQVLNKSKPQSTWVDPSAEWVTKDSAIKSLWNRTKWGTSDLYGKIKILTEGEGYSRDQIVQLKNGELGVKTPQGIKPVDPKGFQLGDLAGDIAESLGAIPVIGGHMAGASVGGLLGPAGSIAGAGVGAGLGEYSRQKVGELLGVREKGISNDDMREILTTGAFSTAGQGMAMGIGKLFSSMAKASSVKPAATPGVASLPGKQGITKAANVINKKAGIKNANSDITRRFLNNPNTYVTENTDDLLRQVNTGLEKLITEKDKTLFKTFLEPTLRQKAIQQGVANVDDVALSNTATRKSLASLLKTVRNKSIPQAEKAELLNLIKGYTKITKTNPRPTYGNLKETLGAIFDAKESAYKQGSIQKSKIIGKVYDAFVDGRSADLDRVAFRNYASARNRLNSLEQIFKPKIEFGDELMYGRPSPGDRLLRLVKDKKFKDYDMLYKTLNNAKKYGVEGMDSLIDGVDSLLMNTALSSAKYQPGPVGKVAGSVPGVGRFLSIPTDPFTNPYSQMKIWKSAINMKVVDPSKLTAATAENFFSGTRMLSKVLNYEKMGKVAKPYGKYGAPTAAQSLNNLLYGGKQ